MSSIFLLHGIQQNLLHHYVNYFSLWLVSGSCLTFFILTAVYYLIKREIAERQGIEVALEQEHDLTAAILNTAMALVVVLDIQGRIVRFNHACQQTTAYSLNEVKEGQVFRTYSCSRKRWSRLKLLFKNSQQVSFPISMKTTG